MDTVIDRDLRVEVPREIPDVETASEGYARRFAGEVGKFFLDVQAKTVLELLVPWPAARVLEVGGGHAQLAGPLAERGYGVTVTGSSAVCRERLGRETPFEVCDAGRLPFPDRGFDVVVAVRLLTHLERWREALAEMCRVARRAVIVDYPDTRSFNRLYGALFAWKKAFEGNTREFHCFRPGEVIAECARHGFGRPAARRQLFVPMVVHRAVGRAGFSRGIERASGLLGLTRALGSPVVLRAEREESA
ncbi:MAG: class I SAM-dependent methyltransferase [Thermoanaerobaculia bacterium]